MCLNLQVYPPNNLSMGYFLKKGKKKMSQPLNLVFSCDLKKKKKNKTKNVKRLKKLKILKNSIIGEGVIQKVMAKKKKELSTSVIKFSSLGRKVAH